MTEKFRTLLAVVIIVIFLANATCEDITQISVDPMEYSTIHNFSNVQSMFVKFNRHSNFIIVRGNGDGDSDSQQLNLTSFRLEENGTMCADEQCSDDPFYFNAAQIRISTPNETEFQVLEYRSSMSNVSKAEVTLPYNNNTEICFNISLIQCSYCELLICKSNSTTTNCRNFQSNISYESFFMQNNGKLIFSGSTRNGTSDGFWMGKIEKCSQVVTKGVAAEGQGTESKTMIIVLSILGAIVIPLIAAVIIYCLRKKYFTKLIIDLKKKYCHEKEDSVQTEEQEFMMRRV